MLACTYTTCVLRTRATEWTRQRESVGLDHLVLDDILSRVAMP